MADQHSTTRRRLLHAGLAIAAGAAAHPGFALASTAGARTLRIGYRKGPLSLLKARGTLQSKLATLGVTVTWTEFPSGPPQLEALNAGSIDFGDVGEAPPIFALAAIIFAASSMPLCASGVLPCAIHCHECGGVPNAIRITPRAVVGNGHSSWTSKTRVVAAAALQRMTPAKFARHARESASPDHSTRP